jgi:UDP-3-O-[3-hydroxymyristoyl] glucosamine N-acyltransferase
VAPAGFTAADLGDRVGARVLGDPGARVTGIAPLDRAGPGDLTHLSSRAWRSHLAHCRGAVVLVSPGDADAVDGTALVVDRPYLAYARLSSLFDRSPPLAEGRSALACIAEDARLDADVAIAPGVVIGAGAVIGAGCRIGANAVVGPGAVLGADCRIHPGAVLCHGVRLGDGCVIHSGAVIGADGFGFTHDEQGRPVAIAQLGSVVLGDEVEVGAGSTIDRGAISDTRIGDRVKIDNQVQIGHNCHIGHDTLICGCTGIVGSSVIGAHCVLAGGVGVGGDGPVSIADGSVISGMTHVSRSIEEAGTWSSGTLMQPTREWKRNALRLTGLDAMARRIAELERRLDARSDPIRPGGEEDA